MADQAAPWPLQVLTFLLSLISRPDIPAPPSEDAVFLLKFKDTLSSGGGDVALYNWVRGSSPCRGNAAVWVGVACSANGSVSGLHLDAMGLSGEVVMDPLIGLPNLRTLSFVNNNFSGAMPDITKLSSLNIVNFSRNNFSGSIADDTFAKTRQLKKVDLSGNEFSGGIPSSLTGLAELQELRVDGNKFDGRIPEFAQTTLQLANVSYNNLEGPIPDGLSKMNASLFEGNKNLCGPPLDVSCNSLKMLPPGLLVGIILIAIVALLAILAVIFILLRRRRKKKNQVEPSVTNIEHAVTDEVGHFQVEFYGEAGKIPKEEQGKWVFVREDRPKFGLQDLLRAPAEILGSGNFGSSYKATLLDGPVVVAKSFKEMNRARKEDFHEHMTRLGRLSHPNLLPLMAYYYRKEEKVLVTDYIPYGSLAHILHGNHGSDNFILDWPTRLKIIKGVARGLTYLYEELSMVTVPHGHLKSSNVLLDSSFEPILTDYALVPVMNQSHASQVMVAYKTPECTKNGRPSRKSDVWNFGILILEILTGQFPMNYLQRGRRGTDLASWVNSVVQEECADNVFDKSMPANKNKEGEMMKLLNIGMACCETDVHKRWEMKAALEEIEGIEAKETDEEHSSYVRKSSLKYITER